MSVSRWLAVALVVSSGQCALAQDLTEYSVGITPNSQPWSITAGPDGNMWFTEYTPANRIGRITPAGVITEFSAGISPGARVQDITLGPDGNLWFTELNINKIGRITPAGVVTEFSAGPPSSAEPWGITTGPDGNLWFAGGIAGGHIGRITPAGVPTLFVVGTAADTIGMTSGPDGNLWFTEHNAEMIGRITPAGVITHFGTGISSDSNPWYIAAGADGNLWFTEASGYIGRITPSGVVTQFGPISRPVGIVAGPDGNMWFTEFNNKAFGRIDANGVITEFSLGTLSVGAPAGLAFDSAGNLWIAEIGGRIAKVTFPPPPNPGFFPLPPCRVLDTRNPIAPLGGPPLQAAGSADRTFTVTGTCGIPADALALSANITVTGTAASGTLSLYRGDGARTGTWSISFAAGQTRANNVILQLALDTSGSFMVQNSAAGNVDFILDVNGYFR